MDNLEVLKKKIEEGLPGAVVDVRDPRRDGKHIETTVIYKGFEGKTLIEQHKMVYDALGQDLDLVHALSIQTKVE